MDQSVLQEFEEQAQLIKKLQYHLSLLRRCVDYTGHEIEGLILSYDWAPEKIEKIQWIFSQYQTKLEQDQSFNAFDLEQELINQCSIDYQIVKSIVRAFYHSENCTSVCAHFVKAMKGSAIEYDALYNEMVRNGNIKE